MLCVCVCVPDGEIGVLEDMCVAVAELSTIKIQVSILCACQWHALACFGDIQVGGVKRQVQVGVVKRQVQVGVVKRQVQVGVVKRQVQVGVVKRQVQVGSVKRQACTYRWEEKKVRFQLCRSDN